MSLPAVQFREVEQNFPNLVGGGIWRVLDGISFTVEPSRFTAVVGPSGCGKSTLLRSGAASGGRISVAALENLVAFTKELRGGQAPAFNVKGAEGKVWSNAYIDTATKK